MKMLTLAVSIPFFLAATTAVQAKGIKWDCDTAAEHFSELSLPAPLAFTVTGRLQLAALADGKKYSPLGRVAIGNSSDGAGPAGGGRAGFSFINLPGSKALPTGLLTSTAMATGGTANDVTLGMATSRDIAFALTYDGSNVALTVDGHTVSLAFNTDRPALQLSCSTGEFVFYDVEIVPTKP